MAWSQRQEAMERDCLWPMLLRRSEGQTITTSTTMHPAGQNTLSLRPFVFPRIHKL